MWTKYKVGVPSTKPNWSNIDCQPFETVSHVCHLRDAYRIFEDGRVRSSLVWDESKLRNTRTCVSWVSPNTWFQGSIFGNISFEFEWRKLVHEKKLFWVEGIDYYNPPVYRILATDKATPFGKLRAYDPTRRTGPLYYDTGKDTWYRNGAFNGEFLIDSDLDLEDCTQVTFVDHHERICKRKGCVHVGQKGKVAGAQLLAMLIGSRVRNGRNLFLQRGKRPKVLHDSTESALSHLIRKIMRHPKRRGLIKSKSPVGQYLATALFARAGTGGEKGLTRLCGLFVNEHHLRAALLTRVARQLGLSTLDQLEDLL